MDRGRCDGGGSGGSGDLDRVPGARPCQEGSAAPSLFLNLDYVQSHPDGTRIRLCVRGGGCATQRVQREVVIAGPPVQGIASPPARRIVLVRSMEFGSLIPSGAAALCSGGPPVHVSLTAYGRAGAAVTASATLGPVRQLPSNRCVLRGYTLLAQFTSEGTLAYYMLA